MFYLLEDNSIVDSENLPKNVKIERIAKDDKGNAFFIIIQYLDFLKTRKIGYIKKQSENICDLIEVGDLVKIDQIINQVMAILEDSGKTFYEIGEFRWFSFKELNYYLNNNRLIIYKPNEKGDYIKVWEEKDGR